MVNSKNSKNSENIGYPCRDCEARKAYARDFDMHFSGDDCPYQCDTWDEYKKKLKTIPKLELKVNPDGTWTQTYTTTVSDN